MRVPSPDDLRRTFETLVASEADGVRGVKRIRGADGPTFLLSCLTHGNEVCGLAPLWYLLAHPALTATLRGTLLLVVNNPEAAEAYFARSPGEDPFRFRCCEMDMNRLPRGAADSASGDTVELRRLRSLLPTFAEADRGIDFHGVPYPGPPLTVDVKGPEPEVGHLSDALPVGVRAANMVAVQDGFPVGWWYGGIGREIPVVEVECGRNESPEAFETGIRCCLAALVAEGFLDLPYAEEESPLDVYRLRRTVKFPDASYRLLRTHENLGVIRAGEVIAEGDGEPIVADAECRSLFGTTKLHADPDRLRYEKLWLTDPPVRRMRRALRIDVP
jgi:predicted deacylase